MARPLRLEFPGALYHVTARGDRREPIYEDDDDREVFLGLLSNVVARFNWLIHAYCLMGNHYHLLIETPDGNLSKGMRHLNGVYTQSSNRRHDRVGHLFQGRYKAIFVQKDSYLLELSRYIVLNPVRACMVSKAAAWPWSSYHATAGLGPSPDWLTTDWVLSAFDVDRVRAQVAYRAFVSAGVGQPAPWAGLVNQVYLGDESFVETMRARMDGESRTIKEIPRIQRSGYGKPLSGYEREAGARNEAIGRAYASGDFSMQEIGEYFGIHYSRVSRIVRAFEGAKHKT